MGLPFNQGLLIKPADRLSQLAIDVDKVWPTVTVTHSPAWHLAGWLFRKKFTVAGTTAGIQANYQMKMTVHFGPGVDTPGVVYLSGHSLDDFTDLRFLNSAGANLDYWIESYVDHDIAYIWIKLDSIPASPGTADFWLYYDNVAAPSVSSGTATMEAFDDFEDGVLGGWTERDPIACTWSAIAAAAKEGAYGAQGIMTAAGQGGILTWDAATFENFRMEAWIRIPDADALADVQGGFVFCWVDNNNYYQMKATDVGATERLTLREMTAGAGSDRTTNAFTWAAATWYKITVIAYTDGASYQILGYVNDVNYSNYLDATPRAVPNRVGIWCASTIGARVWCDTFRVSKYANPEPTFSVWTSEEGFYTFYGITNVKELAAGMNKGDILYFNGAILAKITPGSIGTCLTAHDLGAIPTFEYPP